ncbi:phage tail tip lysozyme [Methylobacterium oryzisoli]|uniref:phage tail tip lysozyme n=1 Tax=Methylobacterium oryzisoli TaxID=3385502 RepID=UPI00389130C3
MAKTKTNPMQSPIFRQTAVRLCNDLFAGLAFAKRKDATAWIDVYAMVGNFAHECMGFQALQEKKPIVPGSKGGRGFPQWTGYGKGGRRGLFEAWCKTKGLHPDSYEANLGYILVELRGPYKGSLTRLAKAKTLYDKVVAFELSYEGAGIKHYPSRYQWTLEVKRLHVAHLKEQEAAQGRPVGLLAAADAEPPAPAETWPEESLSAYEIKGIQLRLRELGYVTVGKPDGDWGGLTAGAIAAFQTDHVPSARGVSLGHYVERLDGLQQHRVPGRPPGAPAGGGRDPRRDGVRTPR